jgi:hypothetical protein
MEIKSFKPLIVTLSSAFAAIFFTKKRIRRMSKLKTVHSKIDDEKK